MLLQLVITLLITTSAGLQGNATMEDILYEPSYMEIVAQHVYAIFLISTCAA